MNPGSENCKLIEASKLNLTAMKIGEKEKEKEAVSFGNGAALKG